MPEKCPVCGEEVRSDSYANHVRVHLEWLSRNEVVKMKVLTNLYHHNIVYVRAPDGMEWEGRMDFWFLHRIWTWLTLKGYITRTYNSEGREVVFKEYVPISPFSKRVINFIVEFLSGQVSRTASLTSKRLARSLRLRTMSEKIKAWQLVKKIQIVRLDGSEWSLAVDGKGKVKFMRVERVVEGGARQVAVSP